jgi:transcriptional regulator with XRE-family HTH domain
MTQRVHDDDTVPMWTLGDRLRKARRSSGIGTSAMAAQLGCHRNSVLGWETDRVVPPLGVVVRWARATHVPLSWFVEDFDPASTNWYTHQPSVAVLAYAA